MEDPRLSLDPQRSLWPRKRRLPVQGWNPRLLSGWAAGPIPEPEVILSSPLYRWEYRLTEFKWPTQESHSWRMVNPGYKPRSVWLQKWNISLVGNTLSTLNRFKIIRSEKQTNQTKQQQQQNKIIWNLLGFFQLPQILTTASGTGDPVPYEPLWGWELLTWSGVSNVVGLSECF